LGSSETAVINGNLIFGNSGTPTKTSDPHRLISAKKSSNAIVFGDGSVFRAEQQFSGDAFGTTTDFNNTVVFKSGSTYDHRGGTTPFGVNAPNTVTTFEKGSRYIYAASSAAAGPQLSGRTYGFLEYNRVSTGVTGGGESATVGNLPLVILDDLIITTGNVRLNVATISIQGSVHMNGGTLVNPTGTSTITLNGGAAQFIKSVAPTPVPVLLGSNVTLAIDNVAGVTLQTPVQITKALTLTSGKLNAKAGAPLTLLPGTTTSATNTSFVTGPITRVVAASGTTNLEFPIGHETAYRPLSLTVNHSDALEARYTAEQLSGAPTSRTLSDDLKKVSTVRYFTVTRNTAPVNLVSGIIQLSYGADDQVDNVAKLRIAKSAVDDKSAVSSGIITSSASFTSLGSFALASTEEGVESQGTPLPVTLIGFGAVRNARGVDVRWTTASENDNAGFEVQRSLDGRTFTTVSRVKGHGQSTQKQTYSILDAVPSHTLVSYYRLRQIDFNGTATYSNVVAVKGEVKDEVFPNPVVSQLTFRLSHESPSTYRIRTTTGHAVMQGNALNGVQTLDVSILPAGLYYLEMSSAHGRTVHKFLKQAE
jgi:hypothetical protein